MKTRRCVQPASRRRAFAWMLMFVSMWCAGTLSAQTRSHARALRNSRIAECGDIFSSGDELLRFDCRERVRRALIAEPRLSEQRRLLAIARRDYTWTETHEFYFQALHTTPVPSVDVDTPDLTPPWKGSPEPPGRCRPRPSHVPLETPHYGGSGTPTCSVDEGLYDETTAFQLGNLWYELAGEASVERVQLGAHESVFVTSRVSSYGNRAGTSWTRLAIFVRDGATLRQVWLDSLGLPSESPALRCPPLRQRRSLTWRRSLRRWAGMLLS